MNKVHNASVVEMDEAYLILNVDDSIYRLRWSDCSPRLAKATFVQRQRLEISPSGYGIHWPEIDEDLAINPLLKQAETVSQTIRQVGEPKGKYKK